MFSALATLKIKKDIIPNLPEESFVNGHYEYVVAHATDTPNDTPEGEDSYFHQAWSRIQAFVHYFVGASEIVQTAPTNFKAWGAGYYANQHAIHVELTEGEDFGKSYANYVALIAALIYDMPNHPRVIDRVTLWSHAEVSKYLGDTNHTDPIQFFSSHGVTWAQFVLDVQKKWSQYDSLANAKITPVGVFYRVYNYGQFVASYAYLQNAVIDAKKYVDGYVKRSTDSMFMFSNATYPLLEVGDKGQYVVEAQKALLSHGIKVSVDGDFGPLTKTAVESFQTQHKLSADGVVGHNTWTDLNKPVSTPVPSPAPKADAVTVDSNTAKEVVAEVNQASTILQKLNSLVRRVFKIGVK